MLTAMLGLLLVGLVSTSPADVTGTWDGSVSATREDGTADEDRALLILKQKDGTITGTVGGDENDQHPITKGTIEGNKLSLTAQRKSDGRELRIELTVDGDEMKGTVAMGERHGQVKLKRQKSS